MSNEEVFLWSNATTPSIGTDGNLWRGSSFKAKMTGVLMKRIIVPIDIPSNIEKIQLWETNEVTGVLKVLVAEGVPIQDTNRAYLDVNVFLDSGKVFTAICKYSRSNIGNYYYNNSGIPTENRYFEALLIIAGNTNSNFGATIEPKANTSIVGNSIEMQFGFEIQGLNKTLISLSSGEYKTLEKGSEGAGKFSIVPKMTGFSSPSGVVSASSTHSEVGFEAWKAFDGVINGASNRWISSGSSAWLKYDFGVGVKKKIAKYSIRGMDDPNPANLVYNPKDWTFEGSNDGNVWTILHTVTGKTAWTQAEKKEFLITNTTDYQMYRINVTASNGSLVHITEFELLEAYIPDKVASWKTVTRSTPTKSDFDTYGIEDLSTITAEQWKELASEHPTVELVTYVPTGNAVSNFSNTYEDLELRLNLKGLPVGQIVLSKESILYGTLTQAVVNQLDDGLPSGIIRILVSFDRGDTWRIYQDGLWKEVYPLTEASFIEKGMTISDLALIRKDDFMLGEDDEISFAYYIEEEIRESNSAKLTDLSLSQTSSINTVELKEASLYILNTVSTIDISLLGTELSGKISDKDLGKVKYRVLLNGNPYYPANGKFTDFQPTPLDIAIRVDGASVLIDKSNTLTVEFEDYWGSSDFWSTTFIGTYSGLIFKEPTGQAYATEIGQVLKYLDIGTLIAGQKTEDFEILLENSYGYDVENPTIVSYTENEGVTFELSKSNSPFKAQEELTWESVLKDGESLKFYLRIATSIKTPPVMGGAFKLIVNADKV